MFAESRQAQSSLLMLFLSVLILLTHSLGQLGGLLSLTAGNGCSTGIILLGEVLCPCDLASLTSNCSLSICLNLLGNCSNNGVCNPSTVSCGCNSGWTGSVCSEYSCQGVANCNNNGLCVGPNTCLCDPGYIGSNCSTVSCYGKAKSDSQVCSGHGSCVGPDACVCNSGYYGLDCVNQATQALTLNVSYLSKIDPCAGLDIVATSLQNGVSVDATYTWTLVHSSLSSSALMNQLSSFTSGQLYIPPDHLLPGYEYVLNVTATYGSGFAYQIVSFIKLPLLFSSNILSPSNIVLHRSRNAVFYSNFDLNLDTCLNKENILINYWITSQNLTYPVSGRARLDLPAYTFPEITDYTITLVSEISYFQSVSTINVQVIADPPIVHIIGGNITMPTNIPNKLDIYALDPEYPEINLTYTWSCSSDIGLPCPTFSYDGQIPIFSPNTTGTYIITVLMQSFNGRTATDTVSINVVSSNAPLIKIKSPVPSVINTSSKFAAQALVVYREYQFFDVEIQWSIYQILPNGITEQLILNDSNLLVRDTRHRALVLPPKVLQPDIQYQITVTANYKTLSASSSSFSTIIIQTSSRPYSTSPNNALTITPSIGNSTETDFILSANGWITDNFSFPLQYSFEYFEELTGTWKVLSPYTFSNTMTTKFFSLLPSGLVQVRCKVRNYYGEEAVTYGNVTAFPAPFTLDQMVEKLESAQNEFISNGYCLTPDLGSKILQISVAMIAYDVVYNSTLISQYHNFLRVVFESALFPDFISQQTGVLAILTLKAQTLFDEGNYAFISLANALLNNAISSSTFHDYIANNAAQIISNIIATKVSVNELTISQGLLSNATQAIQLLSNYLLADMIPEQDASVVSTGSFVLAVQSNYVSTLFNQTFYINGMNSSVFIPESNSIPTDNDTNIYSVQLISYSSYQNMIWQLQNITIGNYHVSSNIVTFRILDNNGNKIPFEASNDNPLIITVAKLPNNAKNNIDQICKYYDEMAGDTKWGTRGCWLFDENSTSVTCYCNHTTSFAAFVQYSLQDLSNVGHRAVYFVSITFNIIFMIFIITVMLFLGYHRNKQPIRSRIYAPFIALFGLLIECALQGIVRNSMLSVKNREHLTEVINIVGYIIVVISVPLSIVTLFVYLWQNIRYFLLRYLYELMDVTSASQRKGKDGSITILICRLLVSKLAFFVLCFAIYLVLFLYYLALSIAGGVKSEGSTAVAKALTITTSTTYLAILCITGIGIILTFVLDFAIVPFRQQQKDRADKLKEAIDAQSSENESSKTEQEKGIIHSFFLSIVDNHFRKDDPLYFRIDSLTIVCAILAGFVSFGIGIAANYSPEKNNSGPHVTFMVFDFLYTILRILAFGGILCIIRIIDIFKSKNHYSLLEESAENNSVEETPKSAEDKMREAIEIPVVYELFRNYCIKEFALENLLVFKELNTLTEQWSNLGNTSKQETLDAFFDKFIKPGAKFEVNIPANIRKSIVEFKRDVHALNITEQERTFNKLMVAVLTNLSDTFSRLSTSEEYKRYRDVANMQRKLENVSLTAHNT